MLKNVPVIGGGQATRTWVSGVGDDANPCSRTAPCKTFAGAISKTAAGGEIDALDPGGFGAVTITKAITLDGNGSFASVLASGTNGIVISAGANDVVTIRNLSINGANGTGLNGIQFNSGAALIIENCVIFNFGRRGVFFQPSANSRLVITDTIIRNNNNATLGGGVLIQPQAAGIANAVLDNVRLERNLAGLTITDRSVVSMRNSVVLGCTTFGVRAIATPPNGAILNLESCLLVQNAADANSTAVSSNGSATAVRFTNATILDNSVGLASTGGGFLVTYGNNRIAHNTVNGAPNLTEGEI